MFDYYGVIIIEKEDVDEDKLMEDAIECGAMDFITDDEEIYEIRTDANDLGAVTAALQEKGYTFVSSETAYIPQTYTRIEDQDNMKGMSKMLDLFDDNDDIQGVWHNWENEDEYEG
jgi:transcriptional/translational regulatory protein YebC/TACO1